MAEDHLSHECDQQVGLAATNIAIEREATNGLSADVAVYELEHTPSARMALGSRSFRRTRLRLGEADEGRVGVPGGDSGSLKSWMRSGSIWHRQRPVVTTPSISRVAYPDRRPGTAGG